jgi:hypothetical protein
MPIALIFSYILAGTLIATIWGFFIVIFVFFVFRVYQAMKGEEEEKEGEENS